MYERFFGLLEAPFRLTPDPRFLFMSPKHADALAHLRLGLEESSGFVCITGDIGTGKTTILRSFLQSLGENVSTAYVFNPALTPLELLQRINGEFGLPSRSMSRTKLTDALNRHLLELRAADRRAIVIIDEAQAVGVDTLEQLRLLSNLETTTEKLLRIVLVGQPQLRQLLQHPELVQLNQRITLRWHIGPLRLEETVAYVAHRLSVASRGQVTELFTPPALWRIHQIAAGVPRLVNMVAHRAMLAAFAKDQRQVNLASVLKAEREISAVPLPEKPYRSRQRAALATAAAGVCLGLGVLLSRAVLPPALPPSPAPANASVASVTPAVPAAPASGVETAATPPPTPTPPPAAPDNTVVARLLAIDEARSLRDAFDTLFAAWEAPPFDERDGQQPEHIAKVSRRRGLDYLAFTANAAMLKMLDVPAVLELRVPDESIVRYAALVGMVDGRPILQIDGAPRLADADLLSRYWLGQAHVVWRDFENLSKLDPKDKGPAVERLQGLLKRVGAYTGEPNGVYDDATTEAVRTFQRTRFLEVDARVGRLTRLALYAAVGGYQRPTLAGATAPPTAAVAVEGGT